MKTRFLTLALTLLSAVGAWAYDFKVDGIYYSSYFDEVYVTYGDTQPSGEITIPSSVSYNGKNYSVTSIGGSAFSGCSALTSVTIPNSVTSIGESAFSNCSNITSITIPNSVTSIGQSAFSGCASLTSVTWNAKRCNVDGYDLPFDGCSAITTFTFGDEVESIPNYLCYHMDRLTQITIPNSVTSIGEDAFNGCASLTSVTIPNSVTSIGRRAFCGCSALTSVTIGNSVTIIGDEAFSYCSALTSVTIPNSVTIIKYSAFYGCSALTSVTIGNNVTSIGQSAFSNCSNITSVTIPNSVTSIGAYAFNGCSALTHIHCEATTPPTLNHNAFGMASFQLVFVPTGTATAYANAWGNNYTYIDSETEITVHVETAGQLAAAIVGQGATPARVTKLTVTGTLNDADFNIIKSNMPRLYNLDLSGISNTTLPNNAFYEKRALLSITLPNGLTQISSSAFFYCSALTNVYYNGSVADWCQIDFSDMSSNPLSNGANFYINNQLVTDLVIPDEVTTIKNYAFSGCTSLTSVTIPNSVTSIGYGAFYGCSALTSVTIPNSVTSIEEGAFSGCTSLGSVTIPNSVTSIGEQAFNECSALTSVTIPNSVTSIGSSAFSGCSALTSITIGNKVQNIYSNTFSDCSQLDTITCLGSVPPTVDGNIETIDPNTCKLYVPNNALMDYILAPVWGTFLQMEGIDVNYQLTLQMNEGGEISCNNHDYTDTTELTFAAGAEVSLKLMPDAGYSVSGVWVNDEDYTDQITEDMTLNLTLKSDATISVSFKNAEYVITFVNDDGTILQSEQLEYGEMPIYNGATPTKETTAEYEYEFIGWSPEITIVTGEARYTATYKETKRSYLISFYNDDNTLLQSEHLEYGEMPIYNGAVPTKEATAEYEYEFIGWSPEITIVTGEARYTATYKEVQLSAYNTATSSRLRAWQADGTLFVEVDDAVEAVMVYDVTGRLMQEYQHNGSYQMLNLPAPNKVNLVKVVQQRRQRKQPQTDVSTNVRVFKGDCDRVHRRSPLSSYMGIKNRKGFFHAYVLCHWIPYRSTE